MNETMTQGRSFQLPAARSPARRLVAAAVAAGAILAASAPGAPARVWCALFVAAFLGVSLALFGAVFLALATVCGARWHRTMRHLPEALVEGLFPWGGALWLLLAARTALRLGALEAVSPEGTMWFKVWWLQPAFLLGRGACYVLVWWGLARGLVAASRRATSGQAAPRDQRRLVLRAALFLPAFAVTFSLACADWLMSLEPMWYSTAWAVYQFAGLMTLGLAVTILLGLRPGGAAPAGRHLGDDQLHDLARLLQGFCCFWMYLWYCQYMLIWYANIPEESVYFVPRLAGALGPVFFANAALNWALPFLALLPRAAKRNPRFLVRVCLVVLLGRAVDLYLAVMPAALGPAASFGSIELAAAAGGAAVWILATPRPRFV